MSLSNEVFAYIDEMETTQSIEQLHAFSTERLGRYGVERVGVGEVNLASREPTVFWEHRNDEWVERYTERSYYFHDPVVRSMFEYGMEPFLWKELEDKIYVGSEGWKIMNECSAFGLRDGLTIPILGPKGFLAGVTLVGPAAQERTDEVKALELFSTYLYRHVKTLTEVEASNDNVVKLTPREQECLRWVADGKTDWAIGKILSVSEFTVRKHVDSAKRKFGVSSRVLLVVEAIKRGLLLP